MSFSFFGRVFVSKMTMFRVVHKVFIDFRLREQKERAFGRIFVFESQVIDNICLGVCGIFETRDVWQIPVLCSLL